MRLSTAIALTVIVGVGPTVPQQAVSQQQSTYTYEGTIRELEREPGMLTLLTGVGLAVSAIEIRVTPATAIADDEATLALGNLSAGDVVRAQCRREDRTLVAERIERLARAPSPRAPGR